MTAKMTRGELERRIRELQQQVHVLQQKSLKGDELLQEAQNIAHIAHWRFDPSTGMPWWSEELYRIYGRDPADGPLPYAEHPKLVHPDDWEWFDATVRATAEDGTPFDIILRIMRPDGNVRIINSICQPFKDDTGAVVEMRGTIQDITERKNNERRREAMLLLSTLFSGGASLDKVYQEVAELLHSHLEYPATSVELYDRDTGEMVFVGSTGIPDSGKDTLRVPIDKTVSGTVAVTGEPVVETDVKGRDEYRFDILCKLDATTFLCAPIVLNDRVLGTLSLADPVNRDDASQALETLIVIASQLAQELDRRWAYDAMKESERKLINAQRIAKMGNFTWDIKTGEVTWSDALFDLLQYDKSEKIDYTKVYSEIHHPEDLERVTIWLRDCIAPGNVEITPIEYRVIRRDGEVLDIYATGIIERLEGEAVRLFATVQDVTERKQAEEALQASESRLRIRAKIAEIFLTAVDDEIMFNEILHVVLEALESEDGVFGFIDEQGDFVVPSMTRHVWDDCNVKDKRIIFRREQWGDSSWPRAIREKKANHSNKQSTRAPEGHIAINRHISQPIMFHGEVIGLFQVANCETDYTEEDMELLDMIAGIVAPNLDARLKVKQREAEKDNLERQLRQAQKMESIGTLSGGIAHDFNNILGIILGNTELAMNDVPKGNPARTSLGEVLKASMRARDIVRHILTFSRDNNQEKKPVSLGLIIQETLQMLRATIPTSVEIREELTAESDTILADPVQMNQVLLNLCTNAAHAMRETGGSLQVNLEKKILNKAVPQRHPALLPGAWLVLTVSDTGHGIDQETLDRIFDPYFTTKGIGEGTGMGLAVVHGIVQDHGGVVLARSEPGKGSVFEVYLPLIDEEQEHSEEERQPFPTGSERILLVDDEEALALMGKRMLEKLQYEVTAKTSSLQALELFRKDPGRFDLVITDMTMPQMSGADLCQEMIQIRPDLPLILWTGYSEMISEERAEKIGIRAFVTKPVSKRVLAETVRKVLGSQ